MDAIVLATGFAVGLTTAPFPITGLKGRSLDEAWSGGAVAYKGMTVSGFPNWFILMEFPGFDHFGISLAGGDYDGAWATRVRVLMA